MRKGRTVWAAAAWAGMAGALAFAGPNEKRVTQLSMAERRSFERMVALSPQSLDEIAKAAAPEKIRQRTAEILALDSLAVGTRSVDADGRAAVHRYLLEQIKALEPFGARYVGSLKGSLAVPVSLDRRNDPARREPPASVRVGDKSWNVLPLWPNGAMPNVCPQGGLEGPLVSVGAGDWEDVKGLDLSGAIVLMQFAGKRNWERLFMLGAQAAIVVEDDHVDLGNAMGLFCNTPVPFPRFYVNRAAGAELLALSTRKETRADGTWAVTEGRTARLSGGNVYENRPVETIFAYLPPGAAATYEVRTGDLLDRIAVEKGTTADDIVKENNLAARDLKRGDRLDIPGRVDPYVVKEKDLLNRLSQEFGIPANVILESNGLRDGELKTDQRLTIPNINDAVVILCRIDSVCVAPDARHGAMVAGNIAVTLTALEHFARSENIRRRRGVLVGFLDGDNHGGRASRAFAEYLLRDRGELKSAVSKAEEAGSGMFRFFTILVATAVFTVAGLLTGHAIRKRQREQAAAGSAKNWLPATIAIGAVVAGVAVGALVPAVGAGKRAEGGADASTEGARIAAYQAALAWFASPETTTLNDETARWMATQWLAARIEKARVRLAETRIQTLHAIHTAGPAEKERRNADLKTTDAEIGFLVTLRNQTLGDATRSLQQRLAAFRERIRRPEDQARLTPYGLTQDLLVQRMRSELAEDTEAQDTAANNTKMAKEVVALLHPDKADSQKRGNQSVPAWLFHFTDGSHTFGVGTERDARGVGVPGAKEARALDVRFLNIAAYAGVTGGWPEEWAFFGGGSTPEFAVLRDETQPPIYGEFLTVGQILVAVTATLNDRRINLDTPRDVPENVNVTNLAVQARTAILLLKAGLENPVCSPDTSRAQKSAQFGRLVGDVRQFNIRSGIDAQDPVPNSYVYYPALVKDPAGELARNTSACGGSRPGILLIDQLNGSYALPVESHEFHKKNAMNVVYAYHFDRASGLFDMVMDQAAIGTQKQSAKFDLLSGRDAQKRLVLTSLYPLILFADVDPVDYKGIPDPKLKDAESVKIVDAVLNGPPRHYAVDNPVLQYNERGLSCTVAYVPAGRNSRVIIQDRRFTKVLLIGKFADEKDDKGTGYPVGPLPDGGRNLALHRTPLAIAQDLEQVAEKRGSLYRSFGIRDQSLERAVQRGKQKLETARGLAAAKDWQAAMGAGRECWGIMIKNYPAIMNLGREAVFSVIFLMALLVPAAVFLERLVIGAKGIVAQLLGATVIFAAGAFFLNFFHPAFQIAVSPFIVMIAFTMILMSVVVLSLSYQRFEVLVRRARIEGGEVESEEISLASSLATAFSLGVSNLKKRPVRTALTAFTVSVLTFSIITFVSVKGRDTVLRREVPLDRDVEGRIIEPEAPKYEGVLFRNFGWPPLDDGFVSAIRTEFGTRYEVVSRADFIEAAGGNNADREGINQMEVTFGGKNTIVNGVMALEPGEASFTQIHTAVSGRTWFQAENRATGAPGHRFHIILPAAAAEALGIKEKMIHDDEGKLRADKDLPVVRMMNHSWRVIGLLDAARADRMRDVNGKSLAMVDYLRSGITPNASGHLENETVTYHLSWNRLAIVPMAAREDVRAANRSIAVKFGPGTNVDEFLDDLSMRSNGAAFSHIAGKTSLMTTKKSRSVGGLAKIIVPIILCILIVANTMMGTVDERKGEVEMLGAVGLSPAQISFLLMSEATVFSVLGIVFGMFGGLAFAKVMQSHPDVMGGLSFNFTSLASTWLAMSTGLVVLIATLVPARRAAALAAPSGMERWRLPEPGADGSILFRLPFTLTRGNAVGMLAFFRRFMLNHTEATSQDFNCRDVETRLVKEEVEALALTAQMWLAPYDLDVAQKLHLEVTPTENAGVFGVSIGLRRTSGTEESWLRTNYMFLDRVRHQFLLWRNLGSRLRVKYIGEGAELLRGRETASAEGHRG